MNFEKPQENLEDVDILEAKKKRLADLQEWAKRDGTVDDQRLIEKLEGEILELNKKINESSKSDIDFSDPAVGVNFDEDDELGMMSFDRLGK